MSRRTNRPALRLLGALLAIIALALAGYFVIAARASGSGVSQPLARISPSPRPSPGATASPPPPQRWSVAKALGPIVVHTRPSESSRVRVTLSKTTSYGYVTVLLVRSVRQVNGVVWYQMWLPIPPNESRGWVKEGSVAIYSTSAKIEIDLSAHTLTVYRRGQVMGTFPVATGVASLPTPTGFYYVNQKLRPGSPGTPYGVLALGTSAFQPKLSFWAGGGNVAIHGTNQDNLIGTSASHGCVRMHNADILKVSDWVPVGSPIIIHK